MSQGGRSTRATAKTEASSQAYSSQASTSQGARTQTQAGVSSQNGAVEFGLYGTFHQAILGVFINESILDGQQVRRMFQQTCDACKMSFPEDTGAYMNAVATTMGVVNARIKKYHMAIKKICAETSVDSYYCLVNKSSHNLHQQQEAYTKKELEYLLELAKAIMESGRGYVSAREAGDVEISSKLTQTGVEEYLDKFALLKFVVKDENKGRVMLGPRALAELEPLLRQKYPDAVKKCSFCQSIITAQGVKCEGCPGRCHPSCLVRLIDPDVPAASIELACSYCQTPFLRETIEKYRGWAKNKCEALASEREDEMDRQARADEAAAPDVAHGTRSTAADTTMEYE